jgi:hypothetical protein
MTDLTSLEGKLRQPNMIMEFDGDWLYLKDSVPTETGYIDTYKFRDGSLCIQYHLDEFYFKWGTKHYNDA